MIKCNLECSSRRGSLQSCDNSIRTRLRAFICLFQLAKLAKSYASLQFWIFSLTTFRVIYLIVCKSDVWKTSPRRIIWFASLACVFPNSYWKGQLWRNNAIITNRRQMQGSLSPGLEAKLAVTLSRNIVKTSDMTGPAQRLLLIWKYQSRRFSW